MVAAGEYPLVFRFYNIVHFRTPLYSRFCMCFRLHIASQFSSRNLQKWALFCIFLRMSNVGTSFNTFEPLIDFAHWQALGEDKKVIWQSKKIHIRFYFSSHSVFYYRYTPQSTTNVKVSFAFPLARPCAARARDVKLTWMLKVERALNFLPWSHMPLTPPSMCFLTFEAFSGISKIAVS